MTNVCMIVHTGAVCTLMVAVVCVKVVYTGSVLHNC